MRYCIFFLVFLLTSCAHYLAQRELKVGEQKIIEGDFSNIPVQVNRHVLRWMSYYQGRGRKLMTIYLERSSRYRPLITEILAKEGLPEDLFFIPLIESGYSSAARSHASAVGYWQFIRGTGRLYGLKINATVDERKDPVLSTYAAAKYFKYLHKLFGDWYLALAAYNTGEGRVRRYVRRYKTKNYWTLVNRRKLPRETRNYVPKYLAALLIAKNPQKYGFYNIKYKKPFQADPLVVSRSISLKLFSEASGLSFKELRSLNPKYQTDWVPVRKASQVVIRVPRGFGAQVEQFIPKSYSDRPLMRFSYFTYHRVRRGDTLSAISRKYRTKVSSIVRLNSLKSRHFLRVGQKLKIRYRSGLSKPYSYKNKFIFYKVKKGDTLSAIARKFRVSLSSILRENSLRKSSVLRVGQKIKLKVQKRVSEHSRTVASQKKGKKKQQNKSISHVKKHKLRNHKVGVKKVKSNTKESLYKVKRGDTIWILSKRFGVSLQKILHRNLLTLQSKIISGQVLIIPH